MYLVALTPSLDDISLSIQFEVEKQKIFEKDFFDKIEQNKDILKMTAKAAGLSVKEYKRRQLSSIRAEEIEKLKEKFGISQKSDDKLEVISYYREVAEKIKNKENLDVNTIGDMFKRNA